MILSEIVFNPTESTKSIDSISTNSEENEIKINLKNKVESSEEGILNINSP